MNRLRTAVVVAIVSSCGGTRSPAPQPLAPKAPQWQQATLDRERRCIERGSAISDVFLTPHQIGFCTDTADDGDRRRATHCHVFDRDTKQFAQVPDQDLITPEWKPSPTVRAVGKDIRACAPKGGRCSTITPRLSAIAVQATDRAATLLALFPPNSDVGELWDLDVLQRLSTLPLTPKSCADSATFFDDVLVVQEHPSCDPHQLGAVLYDLKGRRLAQVGGPGFSVPEVYPVYLSTTSWLFCNPLQLAIHDRPSGTLSRVIDVTKGDPDWRGICLPIDAMTVAVVADGELSGAVAIVDPTSGTVDRHDPPWCED